MFANKWKLCLQVEKLMYMEPRKKNLRTEKCDTLFFDISSATHSFLLPTD
jgi:hypothetical protein